MVLYHGIITVKYVNKHNRNLEIILEFLTGYRDDPMNSF